jgi:hypothetical protein
MPSTIREKILAAVDIQEQLVEVPEWGVTVKVRGMNGAERAAFIVSAGNDKGGIDPVRGYPSLVISSAFDPETGEPVFTAADRDALMTKSGKAIDRVADVALVLSGLTPEAKAAAEKS